MKRPNIKQITKNKDDVKYLQIVKKVAILKYIFKYDLK